jgi:phenylacetate-CoA ligase
MLKVAIVSPFPPMVGGMAVLAEAIEKGLVSQGVKTIRINTNPILPSLFKGSAIGRFVQLFIFILNLRKIAFCNAALVISSSGDYFYSKALLTLYFGKIFNRKVIVDFVGGGVLEFSGDETSRFARSIKNFDLVIVPSSPFKKWFEEAGIPCEILPHIVDIEKYSQAEKVNQNPVFLSAKSLEEHSNIESIIKAFALVKDKLPGAKLLITGKGPHKEVLRSLIKDLKIDGVEFLQNISNDEMPGIFGSATLLLHATRIESFGIVIVEALASGTPVISSNVGGIPDIIKDGYNGYLIEYDDHYAMADRIMKLLTNRELYHNFREAGIQTAKAYAASVISPKLIDLILRIL